MPASMTSPGGAARPLVSRCGEGRIGDQDLPLQTLNPNFGGEFAGSLTVEGKPNQPKLSARFSLCNPALPACKPLSCASWPCGCPQPVRRWCQAQGQPVALQVVKGDGSSGVPRRYYAGRRQWPWPVAFGAAAIAPCHSMGCWKAMAALV